MPNCVKTYKRTKRTNETYLLQKVTVVSMNYLFYDFRQFFQEVGKLKAASGRRVNFLPGAKQSLESRFLFADIFLFFNGKLQINCKPTADSTQEKRIEETFRGVPEFRDI